jgi:hypothetical protein
MSQPAVRTQASKSTVLARDFMILLIVTYDSVLYGVRGGLFHYP